MSSRFGTVDIGSNSLRFLAVERASGLLCYLDSGIWTIRLGRGLRDGEYVIQEDVLSMALQTVEEAWKRLDALHVPLNNRVIFATESLRSSSNANEIADIVEKKTGLALRILDGRQEALYSYRGALLGMDVNDALVFDLGGGSLELCCKNFNVSLPLGAIRIKASFDEDTVAIKSHVRSKLREVLKEGSMMQVAEIIGVGGTSSTAAMILKGIPIKNYHPSKLHAKKKKKKDIESLIEFLKQMDVETRRHLTGLEPGRADIIVSGLCVISAILEFFGADRYTHSECDLLWGVLADAVTEKDAVDVKGICWGVN